MRCWPSIREAFPEPSRYSALGFSLDEVRTLLKLADERKRPCAEVRVVASEHLGDVRAKIADLRAMERVLQKTLVRCARGAGSECPLIEAPGSSTGPPGPARRTRRRS